MLTRFYGILRYLTCFPGFLGGEFSGVVRHPGSYIAFILTIRIVLGFATATAVRLRSLGENQLLISQSVVTAVARVACFAALASCVPFYQASVETRDFGGEVP